MVPYRPPFIVGADISWNLQDEAAGATYSDPTGKKPLEQIMAENGFNYISLRTFVCPTCPGGYSAQGWNDTAHTVTMAKRVKNCGMGLLIVFMMSDSWSSLGTGGQPAQMPQPWVGPSPSQMQAAAHTYTNGVIRALATAGVTPDMTEVGNETNSGMSGIPISDWTDMSALTEAGIQGVLDVNPNILQVAHNGRPRPDSANNAGGDFNGWVDLYLSGKSGTPLHEDIVCGSTYGTTNNGADWTQSFSYVIDTYNKPVMSCEYTDSSPNNNAGQIINTVMAGLPKNMGLGSFNWEPTRGSSEQSDLLFNSNNTNSEARFGNQYTTNANLPPYDTLAKAHGLPVPSGTCTDKFNTGIVYTN